MNDEQFNIAMLSVHSCPVGELGTKETGGMSVYIRELAQELGNRGHHVDIYTRFHDPNDKQVWDLSPNVRLIHIKAGIKGSLNKLAIYPHIKEFINGLESFRLEEEINYDLIHSHYWLSGCVGRWAQTYWGAPHMIMFHTLGEIKNATGIGKKEPELRLQNEKNLIRTCDRIIAATEREKKEMSEYYGAFPANIDIIPCGVNLNLFRPVNKIKARYEIGLDQNDKIILYVGRFDPLKGLDRLLSVSNRLKYEPGFKLVIVGGDDSDQPEMKDFVEKCYDLGLESLVVFSGRVKQENLAYYYSAADITVMPSYHESFGLVALESMACGTPVIAGDVGGLSKIVQHGKTGYILKGDITLSLICRLKRFIKGESSRLLPASIIRDSISPYSWSNIADQILREYRGLIKQKMFKVA